MKPHCKPLRKTRRPYHLLWATLCGACLPAFAQDIPPLTFTAAHTVQTDDNLLRLPDTANSNLQRDDRLGISRVGLQFHTEQGMQKMQLDASLVDYRYQTHTELDHLERNYAAAWQWAVTPQVRGNLNASQQERPTNSTANTAPNRQQQTAYRADAAYTVMGPWQLLAGASHNKLVNQISDTPGQEFSSQSADVGVRYAMASGSQVEASVKRTDGSYLNNTATSTNPMDNKFAQQEATLRLHWALSAASSANAYATALQRSHPVVTPRDYQATNWGGDLQWSLSAKTLMSLGYRRDRAPYPTEVSNFSDTEQVSWGWSWQVNSKNHLRLRQSLAATRYGGSPSGQTPSGQSDAVRDTRLSWDWQPRSQWLVSLALQQIVRDSTLDALDYSSNQISLSGQFSY